MIRINVKRNQAHQIIEAHISGHAEYADHGYDIVCAAVSVLSQTAILGLHNVAKQMMDYQIDSDTAEYYVKLLSPITEASQAILETMVLGLQNIAHQYSDFVTISD